MPHPQDFIQVIISLLILGAFAVLFYRAAKIESQNPSFWATLSVALYLFTWLWMGWGFWMRLVAQVVLFVVLGVLRGLWREHERNARDSGKSTGKRRKRRAHPISREAPTEEVVQPPPDENVNGDEVYRLN